MTTPAPAPTPLRPAAQPQPAPTHSPATQQPVTPQPHRAQAVAGPQPAWVQNLIDAAAASRVPLAAADQTVVAPVPPQASATTATAATTGPAAASLVSASYDSDRGDNSDDDEDDSAPTPAPTSTPVLSAKRTASDDTNGDAPPAKRVAVSPHPLPPTDTGAPSPAQSEATMVKKEVKRTPKKKKTVTEEYHKRRLFQVAEANAKEHLETQEKHDAQLRELRAQLAAAKKAAHDSTAITGEIVHALIHAARAQQIVGKVFASAPSPSAQQAGAPAQGPNPVSTAYTSENVHVSAILARLLLTLTNGDIALIAKAIRDDGTIKFDAIAPPGSGTAKAFASFYDNVSACIPCLMAVRPLNLPPID